MSPIVTLSWLTIAVAGILAAMPAFWSRCTAALAGPRVAVAIATVNAVASLASFAGPYATGHLKDATGTYHLALLTVAAVLAAAAACSLLLRHAGRTVCANDSEIMLHPSPATPFV
ncbi:transporter [Mycobacterium tuberculosis]|nr:transporter [Mycobacterium tuberculosis]